MIGSFQFASIPKILFGKGKINELFSIIFEFGKKILIITGSKSLDKSGKMEFIKNSCQKKGIDYFIIKIDEEPSPNIIDRYVRKFQQKKLDLIIGIGGGSVIDSGKAISAMMHKQDSIKEYLEGVGTKVHDGKKIPYIAVPTTSGTGSEATKNAVISEIGPNGFKKSLRHDNFIPNIAIVDPELTISCPPSITAACGMDAFTQLLESYVSSNSSTLTDSLSYSGMAEVKDALLPAFSSSSNNIDIRAAMAYGSLISGITLANAGLGVVHGFASSIGGKFNIPHGVVCGTLLAEATRINIEKLRELGESGLTSLKKYAKIGSLLKNEPFSDQKIVEHGNSLIEILKDWTTKLKLETLSDYGIETEDVESIVESTSQKNNPVELNRSDMSKILINRL